MAYATIDDLNARRSEAIPAGMQGQAQAKLDDAAVLIDSLVTVDVSDQQQLDRLRVATCAMVNRALESLESDMYGVSNASYTMGPFQQTATFANPSGDLYLTAREMRLIGATGTTIGSIRPVIGRVGPC